MPRASASELVSNKKRRPPLHPDPFARPTAGGTRTGLVARDRSHRQDLDVQFIAREITRAAPGETGRAAAPTRRGPRDRRPCQRAFNDRCAVPRNGSRDRAVDESARLIADGSGGKTTGPRPGQPSCRRRSHDEAVGTPGRIAETGGIVQRARESARQTTGRRATPSRHQPRQPRRAQTMREDGVCRWKDRRSRLCRD